MSTLKKINPELQRLTANASLPLRNVKSRAKPWFETDEAFSTLLELNLPEEIRRAGGTAESELIVDGEVMAYSIMRGALQVRPCLFVFSLISILFTLPPSMFRKIELLMSFSLPRIYIGSNVG